MKNELRTIYNQLCQDDMPMVRRSTATNMGKFAATVEAAHLKTEVMSIFEDLTQDDQDSVRLLAVKSCGSLGNCWKLKIVSPLFFLSLSIFPRISLSAFVTWLQINYMIELCEAVGPEATRISLSAFVTWLQINYMIELCEAVGPEATRSDLVPAYVRLLRDNEAEVRIAVELLNYCWFMIG